VRKVKLKFYRQIGKTKFGEPIYKNLETGKIMIGERPEGENQRSIRLKEYLAGACER